MIPAVAGVRPGSPRLRWAAPGSRKQGNPVGRIDAKGEASRGRSPARPRLVYADDSGAIRDHPRLLAAGDRGGEPLALSLPSAEIVALPRGSDLFMLPGRSPVGWDDERGRTVTLEADDQGRAIHAVAAFLAPAHTCSLLAAYRTRPGAPPLPLFSYGAVGFARGRYWAAGRRVDPDRRQDPWRFDLRAIEASVQRHLRETPGNRLLQQLRRCALEYECRAAQNFFLARHEAPLPTSIACNSRCLGCISLQPDGSFKAAHDRLSEPPPPEDVAEVALMHIQRVPQAVVSFGQGCEGEPLLMRAVLTQAVERIRAATPEGTINLNTNASLPGAVEELAQAGLDSMRVSLNSARPDLYEAYYRPRGYGWPDVVASMRHMTERGRFVSLNLLYFPGVTDRPAEVEALGGLIDETGLEMIQLRNLNIDPELYKGILPPDVLGPGLGLEAFTRFLHARHPGLRFGYFNPPRERYLAWRTAGVRGPQGPQGPQGDPAT
jgi:pyruvate-formate lyase-activating enzyme